MKIKNYLRQLQGEMRKKKMTLKADQKRNSNKRR